MAATATKPGISPLPEKLLREALRLGVDTTGRTQEQVRHALGEAWIAENRDAIESWNAWTAKNGLPLERYRAF